MTETEILSEEQLKEIEARAEKATTGPWVYFGEPENNVFWGEIRSAAEDGHFDHITDTPELDERDSDMEFIAHAREDIPALCQTVRALRAENAELQEIKTRAAEWIKSFPNGVSLDVIAENTALREQLAQVEKERDELLTILHAVNLQ